MTTMYERITTQTYQRGSAMGLTLLTELDPHKLATVLEDLEKELNRVKLLVEEIIAEGVQPEVATYPDKDEQSWEAIESNIQNQTIDECISIVKKQDRNLVCDNGKELIIQALEGLKK